MKYTAIIAEEQGEKVFCRAGTRDSADLPPGEVLIRVHYSSLNYKDALSATGHRGITKKYPHTPGIDAAGIVEESLSPKWKHGDEVIVTGYDLGMDTPGGFGQYIRVPADWIVKKPEAFALKETMMLGTAGFTAGLALHHLELNGMMPEHGPVLVTGSTGGVGSLAVAILAKAGYRVTAATRKTDKHAFLKSLGAAEIISTNDVALAAEKPLAKGQWAGVIDTVGGSVLSGALASCKMFASAAVCGLTQSPELHSTVYPFIIRGNNLIGINSASTPMPLRESIWARLGYIWKPAFPGGYITECTLEETLAKIPLILRGGISGRVLVKLSEL